MVTGLQAQDRYQAMKAELEALSNEIPGLQERVELNVNGVSVKEMLRAIAASNQLNLSVTDDIQGKVINSFSNARAIDVFIFLCKNYDLEFEVIGNIISFQRYVAPEVIQPPKPVREPVVEFNPQTRFISLDLKKDSLEKVAKIISQKTKLSVLPGKGSSGKLVSIFIQNRPFEGAMEKMAEINGLELTKSGENFYTLDVIPEEPVAQANPRGGTRGKGGRTQKSTGGPAELKIEDGRILSLKAVNVPTADLIAQVSSELFRNYFLYSEPPGEASLYVENVTYDEFLTYLLNGSKFTFKTQGDIYLIGERNIESLRTTELVRLENRTIESVIDVIPKELQTDVDIKEFVELNGLILSGSHPKIREIKEFIVAIDQVVPVVMIEVMIVDINKNNSLNTGISAGIGGENVPTTTSGTLVPGVDVQLNSSSINRIISSFNGFGLINLGAVTPDFYMSIQALESNGVIKTRSTPKLSTLNGHEANVKIGQTEYYQVTQTNVIGTQNPQNIFTQNFESNNADLSITIKPIVSGDEFVTLEINVEQSDFVGNAEPNAPRGTVTRNFESTVRIRNQEMILLGGLEEQTTNNTGRGLPFLARVPVLKWIFGQQSRSKSKSRLNVFIKPTILY